MKNYILLYIAIVSVFSFNSFAQITKVGLTDKNTDEKKTITHNLSKKKSNPARTVKSYHVEESINMNFGGYVTTYNVSDSSLIGTYDLGPNNTRKVTVRYTKEAQPSSYVKETIAESPKPITVSPILIVTDSIMKTKTEPLAKNNNSVYINVIKIYERVAEKGYKSIDIFQKLGNAYYYSSEMDKASKWYGKLFEMTSKLEPEYYYRYANSLKAIGQNEKANEMLKKFSQLSANNPK
jgi:tetratricopeptide (TPR) repeat protein